MTNEEIEICLKFLDEEYQKINIKEFKDCIKILKCDLNIKKKRNNLKGVK